MTIKCNTKNEVMQSFEQIRAKNALRDAPSIGLGNEGGRAVAKKVPALIVQDGFLGALAFAIEKSKNGADEKNGYGNVFKAIIKHLPDVKKDFGLCETYDLQKFLYSLCQQSSEVLRAVTDESIAYLNYLRRFAKPGKDGELQED
jgi:CRISPR type III-B/RAMP module-associated protein Cmr5